MKVWWRKLWWWLQTFRQKDVVIFLDGLFEMPAAEYQRHPAGSELDLFRVWHVPHNHAEMVRFLEKSKRSETTYFILHKPPIFKDMSGSCTVGDQYRTMLADLKQLCVNPVLVLYEEESWTRDLAMLWLGRNHVIGAEEYKARLNCKKKSCSRSRFSERTFAVVRRVAAQLLNLVF